MYIILDMSFKDKLKELRKSKELTQTQVANLLNMSKTGYASWEQGLSQPSIEHLKLLCNIFEVSADYLIGLEDENGDKINEF